MARLTVEGDDVGLPVRRERHRARDHERDDRAGEPVAEQHADGRADEAERRGRRPAMSATLRRLLDLISSNMRWVRTAPSGPRVTPRRSRSTRASRSGGCPAMTMVGKRLDLVVVLQHAVVVELPRIGDPAFGGGQFFLQRQEVLVGLEVRVGLAEGEQLARAPVSWLSAAACPAGVAGAARPHCGR